MFPLLSDNIFNISLKKVNFFFYPSYVMKLNRLQILINNVSIKSPESRLLRKHSSSAFWLVQKKYVSI